MDRKEQSRLNINSLVLSGEGCFHGNVEIADKLVSVLYTMVDESLTDEATQTKRGLKDSYFRDMISLNVPEDVRDRKISDESVTEAVDLMCWKEGQEPQPQYIANGATKESITAVFDITNKIIEAKGSDLFAIVEIRGSVSAFSAITTTDGFHRGFSYIDGLLYSHGTVFSIIDDMLLGMVECVPVLHVYGSEENMLVALTKFLDAESPIFVPDFSVAVAE
jgi:hypothetical protein